MKFEHLPNEIIIECFEYFNAFHIFYSFDKLNNRFDYLIHNTRLYINFENVNRIIFDNFCTKILFHPEILQQIYSFQIKTNEDYLPCNIFLSYFSLKQLSYLQKFQSILPLSTNPFIKSKWNNDNPENIKLSLVHLFSSKLKILSLSNIKSCPLKLPQSSTITNFQIIECNTKFLCQLLECLPMLKHLLIKSLRLNDTNDHQNPFKNWYALHLKRLIIDDYDYHFKHLAILLKQTPNLKYFNISSSNNIDLINANYWQQLIKSSLSHLIDFKFSFRCYYQQNIITKFQQFQTKFWQEKHHWFIDYIITKDYLFIYTIPYYLNTFQLPSNSHLYSNRFINVTNLILDPELITGICQLSFPNLKSLTIINPKYETLSNNKYLQIYIEQSLFKLFKQSLYLTSLSISSEYLNMLTKNNGLNQYFTRVIRKLNLTTNDSMNSKLEFEILCEIFRNLEYLQCRISNSYSGLYLLKHLSKLSKARLICLNHDDEFIELKNDLFKQNIIYDIYEQYGDEDEYDLDFSSEIIINIWIDNLKKKNN